MRLLAKTLLLCAAVAVAGTAGARSSDRNQPMDIEANHQDCGLGDNSQCILTGNVLITQGSLNINAAKAVIDQSNGDPNRALLTGSPVVLKQTMDDGTPMTARAGNVDYNLQTEIVVFTGNVSIEQPRGTMSGQRVVYNLKTGRVDSGGDAGGRVKMRIVPKSAGAAPAQAKP